MSVSEKIPFDRNEGKNVFSFVTSNVCLMQQCLCRFNNQRDPTGRSIKQGVRIATQQKQFYSSRKGDGDNTTSGRCLGNSKQHTKNGMLASNSINHEVLQEFPHLDIMLIQEVWIKEYGELLARELHEVFPYIVYDVGCHSWSNNCFLGNSGQMIASRYPILDVRFDAFKSKCSQDVLAGKGLVQAKVLVKDTGCVKYVGYVFSTHLQAYQGTQPIHTHQLNDLYNWTTHFRKSNQDHNDVVLFDVLAGDFNLDNLSQVDRADWNHPIFDIYQDLGRIGPGQDHSWAVGTEMRHTPLQDELIQSPTGLKRALEDPLLLQYYVLDGTMVDLKYEEAWRMPEVDAQGRQVWNRYGGKRRIDYIMQRRSDTHVKPVALNPVSQLAGLTDHIPYSLTLHVPKMTQLKPEVFHQ